MEYLGQDLYIRRDEMLQTKAPLGTVKSAISRESWETIPNPQDARETLIKYESLPDKYKDLVTERYGNPYEYVAQQPLKAMVKYDEKAESFYMEYRYNEGKVLSRETVEKYTKMASWLNMINECLADKKELKKSLHLTIDQFWQNVFSLLKKEKIDLPTSHKHMKKRLKEYNNDSYSALIHKNYGNSHGAKVDDELARDTIMAMLAHPNQYDDVIICNIYNEWAKQNGKKEITPQTIGIKRRENEHLLIMEREGLTHYKDKFSQKIRGHRPTQPLYLVENDDNVLDLYFVSKESKYNKYTAMVVIDSFNNYVLGYAYALDISVALVKAAYMNALYHIKSLTGEWCLPHETKSDRWQTKSLTPFYDKLGKRFEARLGNKHRGYLEPFFGSNHWKNNMKLGANNYSGNNITALNRGVNTDELLRNQKLWPKVGDEAKEQIENFFYRLRHSKQGNGLSKQEEWLNAWQNIPQERKRVISHEQYLIKFGVEHNYRGRGVQITSGGIDFQLHGAKYSYQLDEYREDLLGKSVSILFDPQDLSRVIVTDHKKIRLMASSTRFVPRAIADYEVDSAKYIRALQENQNKQAQKVVNEALRRKKNLNEHKVSAEAILQAGVLDKPQKRLADQDYEQQLIDPSAEKGSGSILDRF